MIFTYLSLGAQVPSKNYSKRRKNGIMWGGKSRAHTQFFWSRKSEDEVAEWLRRWTANPLGSARVGSNPILVEEHFYHEKTPNDTCVGYENMLEQKLSL